jgi:hypothetical protein
VSGLRRRAILLAAGLAVAAALAAPAVQAAEPVSLTELVSQKARFDRRVVIVSGTVDRIEGPMGGAPGQSFWLVDRGASVRVIAPSVPIVRAGDRIEVEGTYQLIPDTIVAAHIFPRLR